jgi:GTPase SAR1 family protein
MCLCLAGIIVVYDVTDVMSFDAVREWIGEIERYGTENVVKLLVGNKCDLVAQRQVERDTALEFAERVDMTLIETSAKNNTNVEQAFVAMAREIKVAYGAPKQVVNPNTLELRPGRDIDSFSDRSRCC